jgi:hypothetical protein
MAKKQKVNKTKAVKEYLKAHPGAMSGDIAAALNKQGIELTPGYVANIKTKLKVRRAAKKAAAAKPVTDVPESPVAAAVVEKPAKPTDAITIAQIKAVGQMVRSVGGFSSFREMLGVIHQVGGLKRLRDLLEAMAVTEGEGIPTK